MAVRLITPPAVEPVDLDSLKLHLRVEHNEDDSLIKTLGQAAREFGEMYTNRAWITQTWERTLHYLPYRVDLPYPPLQSVTSIKYLDADGVEQAWPPDQYTVDLGGMFGSVYASYQVVPPQNLRRVPNSVAVRFVAGYGAIPETLANPEEASVPAAGRQAVKLIVGELYMHREESVVGNIINSVPFSARALLSRMWVIGGSY